MAEQYIGNDLKESGGGLIVLLSRNFLGDTGRNHKTLNKDSWYPGRYLNRHVPNTSVECYRYVTSVTELITKMLPLPTWLDPWGGGRIRSIEKNPPHRDSNPRSSGL
jgi:hypothetical protein